jgi:hypothetical protein
MAGIKIVNLPALGRNLASTDLFELSLAGGTGSRKITGTEILNSAKSGLVPDSRTLTINGTTQDLSADRTFTISTGITIGTTAITSGTVGRVLFEGTGNVVSESANLFWDNTNARLGIGTSSPSASVHSAGSVNGIFSSLFQNTSTGNQASSNLFVANNSATIGGISTYSSANNTAYLQNSLVLVSNPTASNLILATSFDVVSGGTGSIQFRTGGYGSTTERMRIFATGNIGINTTTDAGFKLDINGTARFSGNTSVVGTSLSSFAVSNGATAMIQTASSGIAGSDFRFRLFTNNQAQTLDLYGSGDYDHQAKHAFRISNTERMRIANTGNVLINTTTDAGFRLDVNGTARVQGGLSSTANISAGGALVSTGDVACGNKIYNNNFYVENTGATNIGSGQSNAPASAILCASSTTRGFLPPRMTQAQRNAIASPAIGLEIYQTDATEGKYIYKSSGWTYIG